MGEGNDDVELPVADIPYTELRATLAGLTPNGNIGSWWLIGFLVCFLNSIFECIEGPFLNFHLSLFHKILDIKEVVKAC